MKLEPHVCPVCRDTPDYYGRLARRDTPEFCPNHQTVEMDEDGNKVFTAPVIRLVPVHG